VLIDLRGAVFFRIRLLFAGAKR